MLARAQGFEAAPVRAKTGERLMPLVRQSQRAHLSAPAWVARLWALVQGWPPLALDGLRRVGLPRAA